MPLMIDNGVNVFSHGHDHQFVHEEITEIDGRKIVYQLVPSPGMTGTGFNLYSASPYLVSGGNLPNAGHVRVTVSPTQATVEYVRSAIASDTGVTNGQVSYSYTIAAPPVQPLYGDIHPAQADCDVDGSDLAAWIANIAGLNVSAFAGNFGKNACPF